MVKRKFFVGGNWKCNGSLSTVKELVGLLNHHDCNGAEVVVAPPALYLDNVRKTLDNNMGVASQNCFFISSGAYTGEISAPMLKDLGISYAIIGHSERRQLFNETDEIVAKKLAHAQEHGLSVILCIGENLAEREAHMEQDVVTRQLKATLSHVKAWHALVVAYEPIWAIGTGKTASPQEAEEMHKLIRKIIHESGRSAEAESIRIIYGGSVNAKTCDDLARQPNIDGFLVGGASLKKEFLSIIDSSKYQQLPLSK